MNPPENFVRIIDRKRYDVGKSMLIAGDDFWDGRNAHRDFRNTFLYRTPGGVYFVVTLTRWQNEANTLQPLSLEKAMALYESSLSEHRVSYEEAFPSVEVEDA
jgi:hypothetical protein